MKPIPCYSRTVNHSKDLGKLFSITTQLDEIHIKQLSNLENT